MTSTALISEISSLSDTANKKINARRAMITKELNSIERTIGNINSKISSQDNTIRDLRSKLLEKSVTGTKAQDEDLVKIEEDKKSLQLALATARKQQQRLISQNSELQGRLEELQTEFEKTNSGNLQQLEQVKSTLKIMTASLDSEAELLGAQLSNVNKGLEMVLEDPVLQVGDEVIPVEVDPQSVRLDEEPEPEEDEDQTTDEELDLEEEPELDEEEPELDEELADEDIAVEGIDEEATYQDEPELELEFGRDDGIRIIDSDDEF